MGASRAAVPYQRNTDSIVQVNLDVSLWNEKLILRQQVSLEPGITVLRRLRFRVMPIPITKGSTTFVHFVLLHRQSTTPMRISALASGDLWASLIHPAMCSRRAPKFN